MNDEQAFLAAIRENPEDDAIRLVFSDWLEEHGDPDRAEFIRVQCELAKSASNEHSSHKTRLRERADALLSRHRAEWQGSWPASVLLVFDRGFVARANLDAETLLQVEESLFARHPITHLKVVEHGDANGLVKRMIHLGRLRSLGFWSALLDDDGLQGIERAVNLREIVLVDNNVSDAALEHVGQVETLQTVGLHRTRVMGWGLKYLVGLAELKSLLFCCSDSTGEGILPLKGLSTLQSLTLENAHLTDAGMMEFGHLTKLQHLSLRRCRQVTATGLAALTPLQNLERVFLDDLPLTVEGMKKLAALKSLTTLQLPSEIDPAGLPELSSLPVLDRLTCNASFSDDEIKHLANLKNLKKLRFLSMSGAGRLTDAGLRELTALKNLEMLDVQTAEQITDHGVAALADLPNLRLLTLSPVSQITDEALKTLGRIKTLEYLFLSDATQLTDAGLKALHGLDRLRFVSLVTLNVTEAGAAELRKAIPEAEVRCSKRDG